MSDKSRERIEDRWVELQMKDAYSKKHLRAFKKMQKDGGTSLGEDQAFGMLNFWSAMAENAEVMNLKDLTADIAFLETA